ncbi:MAG: hypothetical protein K6F35_09265 [Lachnospiraceae bacterium]|nr:hypothetical protein [Lachnospiraceae bacterium]
MSGNDTGAEVKQEKIRTVYSDLVSRQPVEVNKTAETQTEDQSRKEEALFFSDVEAISLYEEYSKDLSQISESAKKKKEDAVKDLMDMAILEKEQVLEGDLRAEEDLHNLTPEARKERDRVVRSLKMDEITRKHVLQSGKSLKTVLDTYAGKEHKDGVAKRGKEFFKTFRGIRKKLMEDPFLSGMQKAERLYRIAKPFAALVAEYKELYSQKLIQGPRKQEVERAIERFDALMDFFQKKEEEAPPATPLLGILKKELKDPLTTEFLNKMGLLGTEESAHQKAFGVEQDGILEKVKREAYRVDRRTGENEKDDKESPLSPGQQEGLYTIDRWIINHIDQKGGNPSFLDQLLSLTERERLLAYYLIQENRLSSPNALDVTVSQLGFIPDEKKFEARVTKGLMKRAKRKLVVISKKFRPEIAWEKLEAGIAFVKNESIGTAIRSMDMFTGQKGEEGAQSIEEEEEALLKGFEGELTEEDKKTIREMAEKRSAVSRLELKRDVCLQEYLKALMECRDAIQKRDSALIKKGGKREAVKEKGRNAAKRLDELKLADHNLSLMISSLKKEYGLPENLDIEQDMEGERIIEKLQSGYDKGFKSKNPGTARFLIKQGVSVMAKIDKIPSIWGGPGGEMSVGQIVGTSILNVSAATFSSIQGVIGAIGGVVGIVGIIRHMKSGVGYSDLMVDMAKLASTTISTDWGLVSGAANMLLSVPKAMKKAGKLGELTKGAEKLSGFVKEATPIGIKVVAGGGMAVAGVKLAADTLEGFKEVKHAGHLAVGAYRVSKLKEKGKLQGNDAEYATGIVKLRARCEAQKIANNTLNFATDLTSLGVSIVNFMALPAAPLLTFGWSITSAGIAVGSRIVNYFVDKKKKKSAVDEFLQLDSMGERFFGAGWLQLKGKEKKEYRSRLREHMAAELGFTSSESLYRHILGNYAQFLYENLFFRKDREEVQSDKDLDETGLACYQIIKSLGLKISFPKRTRAERAGSSVADFLHIKYTPREDRQPNAAQIAAKLGA